MDLFAIIGTALISAAICVLLLQYKSEYAMLVSLCCGIVLFLMIISSLKPAIETMSELMQKANINLSYVKAIVKTLGVCYVTQLAADSCRDVGQSAIASKVELAGKVFIVLISLPLFNELVEIAFMLMKV